MDINEIREQKEIAEKKIMEVLSDFNKKTGFSIKVINLVYIDTSSRCGYYEILGYVKARVEL